METRKRLHETSSVLSENSAKHPKQEVGSCSKQVGSSWSRLLEELKDKTKQQQLEQLENLKQQLEHMMQKMECQRETNKLQERLGSKFLQDVVVVEQKVIRAPFCMNWTRTVRIKNQLKICASCHWETDGESYIKVSFPDEESSNLEFCFPQHLRDLSDNEIRLCAEKVQSHLLLGKQGVSLESIMDVIFCIFSDMFELEAEV